MSTLLPDGPRPDGQLPDLEDVRLVTDEVWRSLLGETEELLPPPPAPAERLAGDDVWSAVVTVSGEWHGIVTVELGDGVAADLTRQMLALDPTDDLADADVADAVGELVNMIGGNVKSLMPGPSVLSLPTVAAGRAAYASDVAEVVRLDVLWRTHPVRVCVHRCVG